MTETPPETRSIVVEREFSHPPEKLWRALTQPHLIAEWLMKNDFQPGIGHRFTLDPDWGGRIDCAVIALEPGSLLSYSWNHVHDDPAYDLRSIVLFTLTPTTEGTRLRMEQSGFRPGQRQAYGGAKAGWPRLLDKLDKVLGRAD